MRDQRPLILQFFDFPLVAMSIGILFFGIATALSLYLDSFIAQTRGAATDALYLAASILPVLFVYKFAIAQLGGRPHDDLPLNGAFRNLGSGLLAGALLYSLIVGIAAGLGVFRITGPGDASTLIHQVVSHGIVPGVTEELLFRGIILRWLEEFAGSWIALGITSALFGLAHLLNPNATWFSSFAIAVESLFLSGAYMLTRSLWMPIGLHAAWNVTQGAIFGVAVSGQATHGLMRSQLRGPAIVSGGDFGLEASIIALLVGGIAGIGLILVAAKRGALIRPLWNRT